MGGDHMSALVVMPELITFMDKLSMEAEHTTNLEEVAMDKVSEDHNMLRDPYLRRKTGCTIIGYIETGGKNSINPDADLQLQPRSNVIVPERPGQIGKLNGKFHID